MTARASEQTAIDALGAALAALLLSCPAACAQDWPARPLALVVPFAAGGPIDVAARLIAPHMGERLGQQIVIENMGGAGGMTGSNRVAKAPPDGYLMVLRRARTHAYHPSVYTKPPHNSEN